MSDIALNPSKTPKSGVQSHNQITYPPVNGSVKACTFRILGVDFVFTLPLPFTHRDHTNNPSSTQKHETTIA